VAALSDGVVLRVERLVKRYGGTPVVDGLSFRIRRGECFGLLGPNGAGKTTTLRCCLGLIDPDGGSIEMVGLPVPQAAREARIRVGVVPQMDNLDPDFTVRENLVVYGRYFGIALPELNARIPRLLEFAGLSSKEKSSIRTLSGGMKRRLLNAKALSHEPQLLFLDEPTAGVDVTLREGMWQLVRALRETGVTVILTTHYIDEAEEMADRIGVINKGEIILVEDKVELMRKLGKKQLALQLAHPLDGIPSALAALPLELSAGGNELVYSYDAKDEHSGIAGLLQALDTAGVAFKDLRTSQSSLEDIFVSLVRESQS
jgi:ABC-2 type transport system ATP-binding protein